MKKTLKTILTLALVVVTVLGSSVSQAFAAESDTYISMETYIQMMQDLYAKYDARFEYVNENNPTFLLSDVEKELAETEARLIESKKIIETEPTVIDLSKLPSTREPTRQVTLYGTNTLQYVAGGSYAKVGTTVSVNINPQYITLQSVNYVSTSLVSGRNCDSWTQTGYSYDFSYDRKYIDTYVTGQFKWQWQDMMGGTKFAYENRTVSHSFTIIGQ